VDYVKQQAIYLTCPLQTYGNERNRQIWLVNLMYEV
jgi:hypothetical protein